MENAATTKANWHYGSWERDLNGHESSTCWTDSKSGNYPYGCRSFLTLANTIDLSTAEHPYLSFWHHYRIHDDYSGDRDHKGYVQISTDSGRSGTYTTLKSYLGTLDSWTQVKIDLSSYATSSNVRIRFYMWDSTVDGDRNDGWYIDDVRIGESQSSMLDNAKLDSPENTTTDVDVATENIYGSVYQDGVTNSEGQGADIVAQLGYGSEGTLAWESSWLWKDASYNTDVGDYDQYVATLTVDTAGRYDYAYRFRAHGTSTWTYADLDGNDIGSGGTNGYTTDQAGHLVVNEVIASPPGDANGDGQINIYDITKLERILVELDETPPGADPDCNEDGDVDANDVTCLEYKVVGLEPPASAPSTRTLLAKLNAGTTINDKETFTLSLNIDEIAGLDTVFFTLNFDPTLVSVVEVAPGQLTNNTQPIVDLDQNGKVVVFFNLPGFSGSEGSGSIAQITFRLLEDTNIHPQLSTRLNGSTRQRRKRSLHPQMLASGERGVCILRCSACIPLRRVDPLNISELFIGDISANKIATDNHLTIDIPEIPRQTQLLQNYPNPFNPETWIPFKLSELADVTLLIYDLSGQLIRTIALGQKGIGAYTTRSKAIYWDGKNKLGEQVSSGIYFYSLQAGSFSAMKKMIILK